MAEEAKVLYHTAAVNKGGRAGGESHLKDGSYSVKIALPKELGGSGNGQNPEQLMALAYSACFNAALGVAMKEEKVKGETQVTADVYLKDDPGSVTFRLTVVITIAVEGQDLETVRKLGERAHEVCPFSKATRGNVDFELEVEEYPA